MNRFLERISLSRSTPKVTVTRKAAGRLDQKIQMLTGSNANSTNLKLTLNSNRPPCGASGRAVDVFIQWIEVRGSFSCELGAGILLERYASSIVSTLRTLSTANGREPETTNRNMGAS